MPLMTGAVNCLLTTRFLVLRMTRLVPTTIGSTPSGKARALRRSDGVAGECRINFILRSRIAIVSCECIALESNNA